MSPYYDQPGLRQRGPEDVVGVLVLFACAAVGFCWYVAVSRLHLLNVQCLEIFLYSAILFFGGGLLIDGFEFIGKGFEEGSLQIGFGVAQVDLSERQAHFLW